MGPSYRPFLRSGWAARNLTVGVVNVNVYGAASRRPLVAAADVFTVTVYRVANGSFRLGSGV